MGLALRAPDRAPASVTSSPSKIQVMPSAATTSVWNPPQGRRSSLAGIFVSTIDLSDREPGKDCDADRLSVSEAAIFMTRPSLYESEWSRDVFQRSTLGGNSPN